MAYHSLFFYHLFYGFQLWGQSNITSQNKKQKLQNRVLRKILFKKKQYSICQVYKELKILKFSNRLYPQNHSFMSQIKTNQRLTNSFLDLRHCNDKRNYLTKSKAKGLLEIPFVNTQICGTQSLKYNCIKGWNNFRSNFPHTPLYKCTYSLVKRQEKTIRLGNIESIFGSTGKDFNVLP